MFNKKFFIINKYNNQIINKFSNILKIYIQIYNSKTNNRLINKIIN